MIMEVLQFHPIERTDVSETVSIPRDELTQLSEKMKEIVQTLKNLYPEPKDI